MFRNFLIITLRNILRDKIYLIINVLGLTLGIAGSILLTLYVRHELSYDNFHAKTDRIYRINCYAKLEGRELSAAVTAPPQAKAFMAEFPEIKDATRYYNPGNQKVTVEAVTYHEKNFFYADSNFLQVFDFPLEQGNPLTALRKPYSVILTRDMAVKLYGTVDVIGKNLILNNDKVYQITGLIREVPLNTHFHFDYLASFVSLDLSRSEFWLSQMLETYIVLQQGYPYKDLEAKYVGLMDKYVLPQLEQLIPLKVNNYKEFEATGNVFKFLLQPLRELRFNKQFLYGYGRSVDKVYVYFFSLVAFFLLFIACINFMNLATARYSYRTKEVGIKKVLGSGRNLLIRQFLSESMLITLIAMIIALTLVEIILPYFNAFAETKLTVGYLSKWYIIPSLAGLMLIVGVMSGLYPAYYLSAFNPVQILKSKSDTRSGNVRLRSVLVVIQFSITIILLISTFIVASQLKYIRNKDLGYNKENLLVIENTGDLGEQSETFREQLLHLPGVINASRSWTFPGDTYYGTSYQLQGDSLERLLNFEIIEGDYDFIPTTDIKILKGRNFSRDYTTDNMAVLINESAVKYMNLSEPVGARLTSPNREGGQDVWEIIGVIRDVSYKSLHERIEPMVIGLNTKKENAFTLVRIEGNKLFQTINQVEKTWNNFSPHQPLEYTFVDENLRLLYNSEIQAGRVFAVFAVLAIFVACLGLLGLSAFTAEKRTKEIGIRKTHGASVPVILRLLSKEIVVLVIISSVIAWPAGFYIMDKWLQKFAYRTGMNFWMFVLASGIALIIALAVVVYQSMRAARINPVEALKYE